jgi:radical SAM protein with 4Fe4S-binding SPASM domain
MKKKISNFITIFLSAICYKLKIVKLPYLPLALWIEPTNKCNLKCVMCPNSVIAQDKLGFMDFHLYQKIIDENKSYLSYIILCLSGESLLHPDLPRMIDYAKKNNIKTYLSTNATVLTKSLSEKIIKAGLDWINFSFDGCTKEIYEKVRINAKFDITLKNVIDFLKIKKDLNSKVTTELQIILLNQKGITDYKKNFNKFKDNFKDLPLDNIQIRSPSTWGNVFSKTKKFNPKKLSNVFSPCSYLWVALGILWDGKVVACGSDFFGKNVFGDVSRESLESIWNNTKIIKFRKAMISQKYSKYNDYCQHCDSLWEKKILGQPAGLRGVLASTFSNIFEKNYFGILKKIAKTLNKDFPMEIIKN